jgi:hypothetical protein
MYVPSIIFEHTVNSTGVPNLYTPRVPNSSRVANRLPEFVSRTKANCEPCDYEINIHKGLKQRDHLTAFLFLLLMNNAVALFCGFIIDKEGVVISHLQYAYDIFV